MAAPPGNAPPMCALGHQFQQPPGYEPADFLYGADGPWPHTPEKEDDCKIAPEVLSTGPHCIPDAEEEEWKKTLGKYYDPAHFVVFASSAIA